MKKILKGLLATVLASATALSVASCDTVKKGSVIKNCTVTIGFTRDGEYKEQDVVFELYINFAPATIEHFSYLVEKGYYNDTVVSNLNGYMEFGEFSKKDGALVSKYNDGETGYYGIINDAYVAGKTVLGGGARYFGKSIYGEFADNGIGGNKLDFTGSLVLKRDYSKDSNKSYYNTGKGTMAITFTTSTYFNDKSKYAIIGKLSREDEIATKDSDGNDKTVTSNDFVYSLMNEFKTETDDGATYANTYYYYTYDYSAYPYQEGDANYVEKDAENYPKLNDKLTATGRYFMKNKDGVYYYKEGNDFTKALDSEDEDDKLLIDALEEGSVYLSILPYKDIIIKKIVIEK